MTTDDNEEDIKHKFELRRIKKQVLRDLEEQAAQFAGGAPTHIRLQIKQTRDDIKLLEASLKITGHSQDTLDAVGGNAAAVLVGYRLQEIEERFDDALTTVLGKVNGFAETVKRIEERNEDRFTREDRHRRQRQEENDERTTALEQQVEDVSEQVKQVTQTVNQDVLWRWGNRIILIVVAVLSTVAVAGLVLLLGRSFGWW